MTDEDIINYWKQGKSIEYIVHQFPSVKIGGREPSWQMFNRVETVILNFKEENKLCNYCEKEKRIEEYKGDNVHFEIYGKHLRVIGKMFSFNFGRDFLINYCPMCGRKLGE